MKKILSFLTIATIMLCSCQSYLTENPSTQLSKIAIYKSEAGMESGMNGIYNAYVTGNLWGAKIFEFLGCASLLQHWKGDRKTQTSYTQAQYMSLTNESGENYDSYCDLYSIVNRTNDFIEGAELSPVREDFKRELVAEARFLRAYAYFTITRMWGDAPLITRSPKTLEEASEPRTSYIEIYKQILEDLSFAEQYMRDGARQQQVAPSQGRPNKWAATTLKAKVYLQIGSILRYCVEANGTNPYKQTPNFTSCGISDGNDAFTKTLSTCENIILNGPYKLTPNFAQLFRWGAHVASPEKYNPANGALDYSLDERIFVMSITNEGNSANLFVANRSLPDSPISASNNSGRLRPSRMLFQSHCRDNGGVLTTVDGTPNAASTRKDKLKLYVKCPDPRFNVTYFYDTIVLRKTAQTPWGVDKNHTPSAITLNYAYPGDGKDELTSPVTNVDAKGSQTVAQAFYKKYDEPRYTGSRGHADLYLMRYADVFLMAAEASAELSNGTGDAAWNKALDYIEVIHARARRSKLPAGKSAADYIGQVPAGAAPEAEYPDWRGGKRTFASKEEFLDAIWWERIYELTGENQEWFEAHRKGVEFISRNITAPLNAFLQLPAQQAPVGGDAKLGAFNNMYYKRTFFTAKGDVIKSMLCEFPRTEISANASLSDADQNRYCWNR